MTDIICCHHAPDTAGRIQHITAESAGWDYVGFETYELREGQKLEQLTGSQEACLVLLSGRADVATLNENCRILGSGWTFSKTKAPTQFIYRTMMNSEFQR